MSPARLSHAAVAIALSLLTVACGASQGPSPSPSPSASPSPAALTSPSPSTGATPSAAQPSPSATAQTSNRPVAILRKDSIAVVVSDGLRVRTQPRVADDSKKLDGLLPKDVRLFVAAGPVVASGYSWYLVRPLQTDLPTGWVAVADHDGTPWIKRAAITCPGAPTLAQLGNLERHVALACYGSREFKFRGILTGLLAICDGWWVTEPAWLDDCSASHALASGIGDGDPGTDGTPVIDLHLPPAVARAAHVPDMPYGFLLRATVVGHFDDPASRSCHQPADEASDAAPPVTILVVDCRANFVVTSVVFPTDPAKVVLPEPELSFTGTEDYTDGLGNDMTRYSFDVTNRAAYAPALFAAAPALPPCGSNAGASRTWVHIWDADESETVNAFCGFSDPSDLQGVWFAVPRGELPPAAVYLTLTDRSSGLQVRSNRMPLRGP